MTGERDRTILTILKDALDRAVVGNIVAKRSDQLTDVSNVLADGAVIIYSEQGSKAKRTEITTKSGALIVIHKDTGVASGMYALAARFSRIEVFSPETRTLVGELTVKVDPQTSPTNPIYIFSDGDNKVGEGYGQNLDLRIASQLLRQDVGGAMDSAGEVVAWINQKF